MKSSRSVLLCALCASAVILLGALPDWLQSIPSVKRFEGVFMTRADLPSGPVLARRHPRETRTALDQLVAATPSDAELYALRAQAAEEQVEIANAEADWKRFATLAPDRGAGHLALADFYSRQLRARDELTALEAAAQAPNPPAERFLRPSQQRSWRTFERGVNVVETQALPLEAGSAQFRLWIQQYPKEPAVRKRYFSWLIARKQYAAAGQEIANYRKAFPGDRVFPVSAQAALEKSRGGIQQAVAVYDKAFQTLWPPELVKEYFGLLEQTHNLRRYLERTRAAIAASPTDVNAAVRLFYYYQQQGNLPAAERALVEYRQRKDARQAAWTPSELWTLARLFEDIRNYDEAARDYHALYALPGATAANQERSLAAIVALLFSAADQPLRFGAGDLSYYKDIATIDPHPGFLNGILSLILNSTGPQYEFSNQERTAVAYFHRARADELLQLFDTKFPASGRRAALRAQLVEAYAAYGANDGVIRAARQFLAAFPKSGQRTNVALRMAEAFGRKGSAPDEFATYDALLKELADRAEGVPLGENAGTPPAAPEAPSDTEVMEPEQEGGEVPQPVRPPRRRAAIQLAAERAEQSATGGPRSPDYARVLDRYISRLLAMKRRVDALALLRRELDRNPNDPGLYERLAAFLVQNRLEAEVEQVYQRAIRQFSTMSWYDKLARWYLRRKYAAGLDQITRQVVNTFSGTPLERYFQNVDGGASTLSPQLYLNINRYAHQRFPYDLTFVHNLLSAYARRETADPAAYEALLRDYWSFDDGLRRVYFASLSARGRLAPELAQVQMPDPSAAVQKNPAVVTFYAEAQIWRSHFEEAAPALEAVAAQFPGNASLAGKAAALDRSLAAFDTRYTGRAVAVAEKLYQADRRNRTTLTEIGEIYADREQYARARPVWNSLAQIAPGKPDGYLEAATVFWDYFQYGDALRLISEARNNFGNTALYAYEAGAIYENQRDYGNAVAEYVKSASPGSSTRARLLTLAKRPAHRAAIDKITAARAAAQNPDESDVSLRLAVLDAQNRRAAAEQFLLALATQASSVDLLAYLRSEGERRGLDTVAERALEREIAVTADPVERMQAQLALMRFYEAKADTARARAAVEELYRANPAILGVVRAAVDFYWRNQFRREAVDTLVRASAASNASYRPKFVLEAVRKAGEAGEFARAKDLAAELLKAEPLNAEYIAAMSDTLAREGDDRALRAFYEDKIQAVRAAPFGAEERTSRISTLRRGLVPVLTRLKDYTGGVDQYIEIVKSYPEDDGLAREASAYASDHNVRERLRGYFEKAVADSPRDFRWPMVLARIDTFFEDLPAAVAAYQKASAIRPDRVDLHTSRASLEERLMRFDEALATYTKLYDLTYRNPHWMQKAAEIHARRGQRQAAVKALRAAFIEGRPERAEVFFEVAHILEGWNLLAESREFADHGVSLAGNDLFVDYHSGALIYGRILTRLRQHDAALERLRNLPEATTALEPVCGEIGRAIDTYFTPEEKTAAEVWLEKARAGVPRQALFALVRQGGLAALEAKWLFSEMMAAPGSPQTQQFVMRLNTLQTERMRFDELGVQLEAYWKALPRQPGTEAQLALAAEAFHSAGNDAAELRVLNMYQRYASLPANLEARYVDLLVKHAPQELLAECGPDWTAEVRDRSANAAIASGNVTLALDAVRERGKARPPVWTKVYLGATGLHYADRSPQPIAELASALGDAPIGQRLGVRVPRDQQLAGNVWFYYGTVYGEYAALTGSPDAESFLPALVEGSPASANAYATLAGYYRETGQPARALTEYGHVLELDPNRGGVEDRIALILWDEGKRDEAVSHWKAAFAAFRRAEDARIPVNFWDDLRAALEHVGGHGVFAQVRNEADPVLRTYIRRNGTYRMEPLVEGVAAAAGADAADWFIDLSRVAQNPVSVFTMMLSSNRLSNAQREAIYRKAVEITATEAAQPGPEHEYAESNNLTWRLNLIRFLIDTGQPARAQAAIEAVPERTRQAMWGAFAPFQIRIAAKTNRLAALIETYRRDPERTPPEQVLRETAAALKSSGDVENARRLLEFVYSRELDLRNLTAANFLGLAEIRLDENNVPAGLALLRRMTLVADEPFQDLVPAADLLEKTGHAAEAREFLAARAKAVPWDMEARARLADTGVARSPDTPYEARVTAAKTGGGTNLGSAELDLLAARGPVPAKAAAQPFFYDARLKAAADAASPGDRIPLLRGAIAIRPAPKPPRIDLFRAAVAAREWQIAVSAIHPVIGYMGWRYERGEQDDEPIRGDSGFLSDYPKTERVTIARDLGRAYEQLSQLRPALFYYTTAAEIQKPPLADARGSVADAAADRVKAEIERNAENQRRRPVVSSNLEQDRLVRTRITAGGAK